ncbi:hypothetical protein DES52_10960 [Deinococcus yavapaiensis KR-236]|uniref:Uncharacterized protein n=2 Tax=Deinococcus TaxID=1298 RepID=A0A318SH76_9DEIO|nr:hypothetical protein DES52_10960 [Deinococcus yavapaiensis KR-236]
MDSVIYQIVNGQLVEMREQPYDTEALLQDLLASHPNLLAGEQMNPAQPRRWLLVRQEMSVPDTQNGSGRWSLDHLFLDQDAVPTLVEVKRSSDTRIRREVVGQMLDYAANAVVYWPVEQLRADFEQLCDDRGVDANDEITQLTEGGDPDAFWLQVKTNLQAGRIRMIFVADVIPPELRRVVEFLNGQMDPAEVLALEVKQFRGGNTQALVPRLIGQSAAAEQKKNVSASPGEALWTSERFLAAIASKGEAATRLAQRILDRAAQRSWTVVWGKGKTQGSFMIGPPGMKHRLAYVWTYGVIWIGVDQLRQYPPFDDPERRADFIRQLNDVANEALPHTNPDQGYQLPLEIFAQRGEALIDLIDQCIQEVAAKRQQV